MEVEKDDNEVLVHFERWNSRYDEYVKIDSERLRVLLPERSEALEKEKEKVKKVKYTGLPNAQFNIYPTISNLTNIHDFSFLVLCS